MFSDWFIYFLRKSFWFWSYFSENGKVLRNGGGPCQDYGSTCQIYNLTCQLYDLTCQVHHSSCKVQLCHVFFCFYKFQISFWQNFWIVTTLLFTTFPSQKRLQLNIHKLVNDLPLIQRFVAAKIATHNLAKLFMVSLVAQSGMIQVENKSQH